jgi:hypothetical protein
MTTNLIPKAADPLVTLGQTAYSAALALGDSTGLKQNTAAAILKDLERFVGQPGATPEDVPVPGAQAIYHEAVSAVVVSNAAHRKAVTEGRDFCSTAIAVLKVSLGRRWSSAWSAAGFNTGSLAVPMNPEPLLMQLRWYFAAHPEREIAQIEITVAGAQRHLDSITQARQAANAALAARVLAKKERDQAQRQLKYRLSGLRTELDQLLDGDDERWYQFGFVRPTDGRAPAPVSKVIVRPGLPGEALVAWQRPRRAESYRVTWRIDAPDSPVVNVGLFSDFAVNIQGLPSGVTVLVGVAARNETGEAESAERALTVP